MGQGTGELTGVSLVAIEIELVRASRRTNMLVRFDRIHPSSEPTTGLSIRPAPIGFQHASQSQNPRRRLDVHEGYLGT